MSFVKRIVVVDDELLQLAAVSRILQDRDFDVASFSEADEALEFIKLSRPDLVISDLRLPSLNGIEFIKRIKTFDHEIECILMTGHGSVDTAVDAMRLGVRDYLAKPFRSAELLTVVDRVLYVSSLKKQNQVLMRDLTKSNEQLREINFQLDTFAGRVAHDLNSMIALIQSYSRLLDKNISSGLDEQSRKFLSRIRSTSDRGATLVSDLLAFARLGAKSLSLCEVNVSQVVERARVFVALDARQNSIAWKMGPLPKLYADESLLEQVFSNLFSNSVKYTRHVDEPVIELRAWECEDFFHFSVVDNGAGFELSQAADLFLPFKRLHDPAIYEGNGLGLVNVKRIVEKHGGRIIASSKPGAGANFQFTIAKLLNERNSDFRSDPTEIDCHHEDSGDRVNGLISDLVQVSKLPLKPDDVVTDLIAQYVHKLNNAMLPFVLELDNHLDQIDQYSNIEQLKLKGLDNEIKAQINAIKKIRSLIGKKSPDDID